MALNSKKSSHYARTRKELAAALGYDVNDLSAVQEMKLDNAVALKLVSDGLRAALIRGEEVDHKELLAVTEGLQKLLPREPEPAPVVDPNDDPHGRLMRIIDAWIANHELEKSERVAAGLPADAKDARIVELEVEVARLRGLPAPDGDRVIDVPTSAITPPSEQTGGRNLTRGMRRGPDDPPPRSTAVIDAKAEPVERMPDGTPCPPGGMWCPVRRRVVPIEPVARSGAETKASMDRVNARRDIDHKIMSEQSRVAHEPAPSLGNESWRFPNPGHWGGDRGTEW
jgi:hypothetical protein